MQTSVLTLLYTTLSTTEEAEKLARLVLAEKLAGCVNIIPGGRSIYLWNDKIEDNPECYLLFKTTSEKIESLQKFILQHHSYQTPALLHWEAGCSEGFFEYINRL